MARDRGDAKSPPEFPAERIDAVTAPLRRFLSTEAAGAVVLVLAAIIALLLANSPYRHAFEALWATRVGLHVEAAVWDRPLRHWINDGLMTLFFFVVGLEVKRQLADGELRQPRRAALAVAAAVGGALVPAVLYLGLASNAYAARGWGAVMTTDTAFVIGCLALVGRRIPDSLRVLVLGMVIIDDIVAVLVISIAYGHGLETSAFGAALAGFAAIALMRWLGVRSMLAYWLVGLCTWAALHEAGIHPTIAGVILALLTPTKPWVDEARLKRFLRWAGNPTRSAEVTARATHNPHAARHMLARAAQESVSPLERLERGLHPWSSFFVLPLFALANAGIAITGTGAFRHVTLITLAALMLGKPLGIFSFAWVASKLRIAEKPEAVTWPMLLYAGILAGMGFTMALFIGQLAFAGPTLQSAKLGVLIASLLAGTAGTLLLRFATSHNAGPPGASSPRRSQRDGHRHTSRPNGRHQPPDQTYAE